MKLFLTVTLLPIVALHPGLAVTAARCETTEGLWAIALHGGAGRLSRDTSPERVARYKEALAESLDAGVAVLESGGSALDAAETTVRLLEDCPLFNAGRGSVFDQAGGHAMDASVMVGSTLRCGGVASVASLRNPIEGARIVMEKSAHVLMGGDAAERFAARHGAGLAPRSYFSTRYRFEKLAKAMRDNGVTPPNEPLYGWSEEEAQARVEPGSAGEEAGGTVGCVALDIYGELVAATSTGGRNNKMVGRIGDSPIPGAGNYANARVAVGGTGKGEEFLRHFATGRVGLLVASQEMTVDEACKHVLEDVLRPGDGGLIAVGRDGEISMRTTTGSMPSAAADSRGRREIAIWHD